MRYIIEDKKYRFKSAFDTETGAYVRTGVLVEQLNMSVEDAGRIGICGRRRISGLQIARE